MKKHIFLFVAFACIGITTEIFFTAIVDLINNWPNQGWALKGASYIWMFPIYGIAGIAFPAILPYIQKIPFVGRILIYGVGILIVEFIAGGLLDLFTGKCPWEYTTGLHIMGYIRLDYFPLWALFGGMVEKIVVFLQSHYKD